MHYELTPSKPEIVTPRDCTETLCPQKNTLVGVVVFIDDWKTSAVSTTDGWLKLNFASPQEYVNVASTSSSVRCSLQFRSFIATFLFVIFLLVSLLIAYHFEPAGLTLAYR